MSNEMSPNAKAHDVNGNTVVVGDQVKVLSIRNSVLARLEPEERRRISEMQDSVFTVYEIDEWGGAWVRQEWQTGGDCSMSHSLSLSSTEMQKVNI